MPLYVSTETSVGRENNYKKQNAYIFIHILYAINEQKTCVNAIRVAMHDTLHAVNLGI